MRWFLIVTLVFSFAFLSTPAVAMADSPAQAMNPTVTPTATAAAATTSPAAVAAAATCASPYTVITGDTLTGIAQKCNVAFADLIALNGNISNVNLIFPGQQVVIPQSGPGIPTTGSQTYTVVAGDDLFSIAQRFNTTVQNILNANTFISNQNIILPGWVLTIPGSTTPGIPPTGGSTYTVVSGDTLSGIAVRFNTTTAALLSANTFITNPNLILPGWVLNIQ